MDLLDALEMDPEEVERERLESLRQRRISEQTGVFGIQLASEAPTVMCDCMAYLRDHGLDTEGIFRIPGKQDLVEDLKAKYENYNEEGNGKIKRDVLNSKDIGQLEVHDVATLLKAYLRSLHEPLIPRSVQEEMMDAILNVDGQQAKMQRISEIIKNMYAPNRECLGFLVSFLREVALFEKVNKMSHVNIATCFAPSVFRSPPGRSGQESLMDLQLSIKILCDILTYIPPNNLYMPSKATVEENTQYKRGQAPPPPPRQRGQTGIKKPPPGMFQDNRAGGPNSDRKLPDLPPGRLPPGLDTSAHGGSHYDPSQENRPLPPQPPRE